MITGKIRTGSPDFSRVVPLGQGESQPVGCPVARVDLPGPVFQNSSKFVDSPIIHLALTLVAIMRDSPAKPKFGGI